MMKFIKKTKLYLFTRKLIFSLNKIKNKCLNHFFLKTHKCARVLTYHRITDIKNDPVHLAVSLKNFEEQIDFISKNFKIISLKELVERIKLKKIEGDEFAITFDDGYKDNLLNAVPILKKYNAPATIFVTTSKLGKISNYEWDEEYSDEEKSCFLTENEIYELKNTHNIEIGGHTENHKSLNKLKKEEQLIEIEANKIKLENILKQNINFFAYPFGQFNNINKDSVKIVSKFYSAGFLDNDKLITKNVNLYKIPRINIRNWELSDFKKVIYHHDK